jgi:predicted HTH transcriptional regulator
VERLEKRKSRILQAAREQGRITNDGVEDLFCIGDRTASKYLHQLTQAGELTRHGAGRGTYYTPT